MGTGDNVLIAGFKIAGSDRKATGSACAGTDSDSIWRAQCDAGYHARIVKIPAVRSSFRTMTGKKLPMPNPFLQICNRQNDLESAILTTLNPGAYTAILRGFHNSIGTALVEVYDTCVGSTELSNISTRGFVQTGDNVMIAGVIVQFHNKQVIVRALGPTLTGLRRH